MNLRNVWTMVRFTMQEAVSRKLILAGLVLSVAFLLLFGWGYSLLFAEITKGGDVAVPSPREQVIATGAAFTLLGLYAISFLASFMALFLSVGAISGEIDSGTLHSVLAKPVRRAEYLLGRWLGYCGLTSVYVAIMGLGVLVISYLVSGFEVPDPARAIGFMMLQSVALLSMSLLGSTLMPTLANGVVAFGLFGLSWLAGIIDFAGGIMRNESMRNLATGVSLVVPSDGIWKAASYYVQPPLLLTATSSVDTSIPFIANAPPTGAFVVWVLLYPLVLLALGMWTFQRRDL